MPSSPKILVRQFEGLDICYRIAARRARNYWELLEYIHGIFNKSWGRYNAHLHFDGQICEDRISPSEWDAGGYFDPEFIVDGRIVLYAHFEAVEGRSIEDPYSADLMEIKDEDKMWYNGTYGDEGLKIKRKIPQDFDDASDAHSQDPYLPIPENIPPNVPTPNLSNEPIPATKARSTPLNEITTVDGCDNRKLLDTCVIIGRALPERCLDPNVRPLVHATITRIGSVVAYISAKYAKRRANKVSAQIHMSDIEYVAELEKIPFGPKRTKAIKEMIEEKIAKKQTSLTLDCRSPTMSALSTQTANPTSATTEFETVGTDDPRNRCSHGESIVIGHAEESWCRDPNKRPLVYARLRVGDGVVAFTLGKYAKHQRCVNQQQIRLGEVDFVEEFSKLHALDVTNAIKKRLVEQREASERERERERELQTRPEVSALTNDGEQLCGTAMGDF